MGRSVSYLSNAQEVTYFYTVGMGYEEKFECPECDAIEYESGKCDDCNVELVGQGQEYDEDFGRMEWRDFVDNIQTVLMNKYPSLQTADKWDGDETSIILENNLCEIGISEYCGLTSLSIRPAEYDGYYAEDQFRTNFAPSWIAKVWPNMLKVLDKSVGYERLYKQGTFSNGEGVYAKAS